MSESEAYLQILLPLVDVSAPGIFRLSGNNNRQSRLVEALRSGQNIASLELNSHDIATVVKQVLREYPGRLFDTTTESILSRLVKDTGDTIFRLQDVLKTLSPDRISFLALVLPFLNKVSQLSEVNKMDASNLARVVALDFFPDISNPLGTDSTLVRQIIDWRIKIVERLIAFGDKIVADIVDNIGPRTPIQQYASTSSVTPVFGKSDSTTTCLMSDASQKRKRPPQSPLKAVWNGFANIFSKTPRPGRPESTPPNGTPSFFSKFSNRLCPSGKKVKPNEEEESTETMSGYRSDDNSLRCPPVKQNLRSRFSHKKKSPKITTPRLKTPATPFSAAAAAGSYGTFSTCIARYPPEQVRTELFDFTARTDLGASSDKEEQKQIGVPFVFSSSQQNISQQSTATMTVMLPPLSPVNISPDLQTYYDNGSGDSNSKDEFPMSEDAMETATCETDIDSGPSVSSSSIALPIVNIPEPSPSMSHLSDEMRDSLCDLLNIGVTPRSRHPILEKHPMSGEPVVETTFDLKDEAERRFIAQVKSKLGPLSAHNTCPSGSRRPSVANLERMGQVSQGRRLWEQGGVCTSSMSTHTLPGFAFSNGKSDADAAAAAAAQMFQNSYPRLPATSKRQTDL